MPWVVTIEDHCKTQWPAIEMEQETWQLVWIPRSMRLVTVVGRFNAMEALKRPKLEQRDITQPISNNMHGVLADNT